VYPANACLFLSVTNLQNFLSTISKLKIEGKCYDQRWVDLTRIPTIGNTVYPAMGHNLAGVASNPKDFFDMTVIGKGLEMHESLKGWVPVAYPLGCQEMMPVYRVTVSDEGGVSFRSAELQPKPDMNSVQGARMDEAKGVRVDLSTLQWKSYSEP
jgi:hypothetical protein